MLAAKAVEVGCKQVRDLTVDMLDRLRKDLAPALRKHCAHVVSENGRVIAAAAALAAGRLEEFGDLMNAPRESLRDDFEISYAEIDTLVEIARRTEGVPGARMTGGGFGGCAVNLVRADAVDSLIGRAAKAHPDRCGLEPGIVVLSGNLEAK